MLKRTKSKCAYCGIRCVSVSAYLSSKDRKSLSLGTLDHVRPRKHGGADHIDNLILACMSCNLAKGSMPWWRFCPLPRYNHLPCFSKSTKNWTATELPAKLEGPGQSSLGFQTEQHMSKNQTSLFPSENDRDQNGDGAPIDLYRIRFDGAEPDEEFGTDKEACLKRLFDLTSGDEAGTTSTPTMQKYTPGTDDEEGTSEDIDQDDETGDGDDAFDDAAVGPFTGYHFYGDERDWTVRPDDPTVMDCWSQGDATPMCAATWDGQDVYIWMPDGSQEILVSLPGFEFAIERTMYMLVGWGAETLSPHATVTEEIADAFGMAGLPNTTVLGKVVASVAPSIKAVLKADAAAEAGKAKRTTAVGVVSAIAEARIEDADTRLARIGLVRPSYNVTTTSVYEVKTVTEGGYQPGTAALDEAYDRLSTSRRLWEERPPVEDGLDQVIGAVLGEERVDVVVNTGDLRMLDDGRLHIPGLDVDGLGMEILGLEQLLPKVHGLAMIGRTLRKKAEGYAPVFPEALTFLLSLPADERAWIMNKCFQRSDSKLKLRTRLGRTGQRQLFAVVSPTYAVFDADKVATIMRDTFAGKGLRGEVSYEASSTDLYVDASYHASADIQDFAAGDLFQVGYRGTSNDTGLGAVRIGGSADWNACLNFLILSHAEATLTAKVHKGDPSKLVHEVVAGVTRMDPVFQQFAREWGVLRDEPVSQHSLWGQGFASVEDALTWGVNHGKIDMGLKKDIAIEALLQADRLGENQGTLAAIVDAVTRAAHMQLIADCERDRIERMAGALVPVLVQAATA